MTDQECARTLRRLIDGLQVVEPEEITAVNRACELLEREAKRSRRPKAMVPVEDARSGVSQISPMICEFD